MNKIQLLILQLEEAMDRTIFVYNEHMDNYDLLYSYFDLRNQHSDLKDYLLELKMKRKMYRSYLQSVPKWKRYKMLKSKKDSKMIRFHL